MRQGLLWMAAILSILMSLGGTQAYGLGLKPFVRGSIQRIEAAHRDQPFVLAFWSLTCAHCLDDLALLGKLSIAHPRLVIVLVSTDTPTDVATIRAIVERHGLARTQNWVFADDYVERLRFEVDPGWRGELPRTYFYTPGETRRAKSGKLDPNRIEQWIARLAASGSR